MKQTQAADSEAGGGWKGAVKDIAAMLLAGCFRVLTGATPRFGAALPEGGQFIFYANHTSHFDAVVLWALLPPGLRARTRPVAAKDYWMKGPLRKALAYHVFKVVLVARGCDHSDADAASEFRAVHRSLMNMSDAIISGASLILFPEGTRGDGETVAQFKSGLYHLARMHPGIPLVPVYMENLNRILPKGEQLIVPLICKVHFGAEILLSENETRSAFLDRARRVMEELNK